MRLWSIHPRYFDAQALVTAWREGLQAQQLLIELADRAQSDGAEPGDERTSALPQLRRFLKAPSPIAAIGGYLTGLADEADERGTPFDRGEIAATPADGLPAARISVTDGQLDYEWGHLTRKLLQRSPAVADRWARVWRPEAHPLFAVVGGGIAEWELG